MRPEQDMQLPGLLPGERSDALSIAALYGRVAAVLGRAFARGKPMWVRGEIQSISDRTGHCYIDLVDPDAGRGRDAPLLKVNCWSSRWTPLKAVLERQGIVLEPGLVVTLQGRLDVYPPRGQLNFIATDLDVTALLGRLAARRAALLRSLESEGLLRRNKALEVPEVPLRVGLVASRDTEGFRDFSGRLLGSGFAFQVVHTPVQVQGASAPKQIASGISRLCGVGCDLIVVVRGGGSKGDLSAFDSEPVARSIAVASVPVWTGIGHTGDQSVADIVANCAFVTPTECGTELVSRVASWWGTKMEAGANIGQSASHAVTDALRRDSQVRARLCSLARNQLHLHSDRLGLRASRITVAAPRCSDAASSKLVDDSRRLGRAVQGQMAKHEERVVSWRRLIAAYDVERQLERGYTITLDEDGRLLRHAASLTDGRMITTRFVDGQVRSEVKSTGPASTEGR